MILQNARQVEVTRKKLQLLEEHYEKMRNGPAEDEHVRELTLRSLRQFINQLKEDIARFECHATAHG